MRTLCSEYQVNSLAAAAPAAKRLSRPQRTMFSRTFHPCAQAPHRFTTRCNSCPANTYVVLAQLCHTLTLPAECRPSLLRATFEHAGYRQVSCPPVPLSSCTPTVHRFVLPRLLPSRQNSGRSSPRALSLPRRRSQTTTVCSASGTRSSGRSSGSSGTTWSRRDMLSQVTLPVWCVGLVCGFDVSYRADRIFRYYKLDLGGLGWPPQ